MTFKYISPINNLEELKQYRREYKFLLFLEKTLKQSSINDLEELLSDLVLYSTKFQAIYIKSKLKRYAELELLAVNNEGYYVLNVQRFKMYKNQLQLAIQEGSKLYNRYS